MMSSDLARVGSLGKGGLRLKQVRVERPRPLKIGGGSQPELSTEHLLVVVDSVTTRLTSRQYDNQLVSQLGNLVANFKVVGPQLELNHKEAMDKLNSSLMGACRDESLDLVARVHMLEIIELRTMGWKTNENVTNYYKQKLAQIELESVQGSKTAPVILNPSAPDFSPHTPNRDRKARDITTFLPVRSSKSSELNKAETLKTTSKAVSDNKVIMSESKVGGEGDPQKPESPCADFSAMVKVGNDQLTISGATPDLVRTAKIVLSEFFNICPPDDAVMESPPPEEGERLGARRKNVSGEKEDVSASLTTVLVKPEICYNKEELLKMSSLPLSKAVPENWSDVVQALPGVVRRADRAGPTSKIIQREMMELRRQEAAETKHV